VRFYHNIKTWDEIYQKKIAGVMQIT